MKYIKTYSQLNEKLTDKVYHFTNVSNIYNILNTNKIHLTPVFGTKADSDLNSNKLYALSVTSSRSSDIGYAAAQSKNGMARITFDGRKLNQNYKSKRVDYWQKSKDPKNSLYNPYGTETGDLFYKHISRQNELEDRILSDNNDINNASKYILQIDCMLFKDEHGYDYSFKYIGNIKRLCNQYEISLNVYTEQKSFDHNIVKNAIEVQEENKDIEKRDDDYVYYIETITSMLVYKDDKMKDKIYDYIKENYKHYDKLIETVEKQLLDYKYYLSYPDDYRITDKASALNSHIHNVKRTTNKVFRFIVHELALDMKRNKCINMKEYITYKIWKDKKTQKQFNIELNDKVINIIDKSYKKELKDNVTSAYDIDDNRIDNIYDFKPVKQFIDEKIKHIKDYCSKYILTNEDMFRYSYVLGASYIKKEIDLDNVDYSKILTMLSNSEDYKYYIERIIYGVIYEIDYFYYDEINRIQEENRTQWGI